MDNEGELNDGEQEAKLMAKPPKNLSFCERIKKLFLHHSLLKEWMKDCTISYEDLLCLNQF